MVVIRSMGLVGAELLGVVDESDGKFLQRFDAEARSGKGDIRWTDDKDKALRFHDVGEALKTWKTVSAVNPLRGDGQPNRPLTAYSVIFEDE